MNIEKDIQEYILREKKINPNPWLATRIMTRIETPDQRMAPRWQSAFLAASILFAVLLGIVFIGETIGLEEALAMLVIISAVLLISLPQWRKPGPKIR